MSFIADILSFTKPVPEDNVKVATAKSLKVVNGLVQDIMKTMPDDKEMLQEDQELWLKEWNITLVRGCLLQIRGYANGYILQTDMHIALQKACEHSMEILVNPIIMTAMQEASLFIEKWKAEVQEAMSKEMATPKDDKLSVIGSMTAESTSVTDTGKKEEVWREWYVMMTRHTRSALQPLKHKVRGSCHVISANCNVGFQCTWPIVEDVDNKDNDEDDDIEFVERWLAVSSMSVVYIRGLVTYMPIFTILFFIFTPCNTGIPLSRNFLGEQLSLIGIWEVNPIISALGATGIVLSIFLYNRISYGTYSPNMNNVMVLDITRRELMILISLLIPTILLGIFPNVILDSIHVSVSTILYNIFSYQESVSLGITLGIIFILLGLLLKIAAAPLHNWAPDVYDNSPTIVTIWLTIMPKMVAAVK